MVGFVAERPLSDTLLHPLKRPTPKSMPSPHVVLVFLSSPCLNVSNLIPMFFDGSASFVESIGPGNLRVSTASMDGKPRNQRNKR